MDAGKRLPGCIFSDAGGSDGKQFVGGQCVEPGMTLQRLEIRRSRFGQHNHAIWYAETRLSQLGTVECFGARNRFVGGCKLIEGLNSYAHSPTPPVSERKSGANCKCRKYRACA